MKKIIIWIFSIVAILVVVALAVAFFSLNSLVKKGVETYGPKITGVDVRLDAAEISPFSGSGRLVKFFVGNPSGYKSASAFEVADAKLGVQIGSVLSDTIVVNEINIQSPEITLEGTLDANNLGTILKNLKAYGGPKAPTTNAPAAADTGTPKKFIVKDIVLTGAKVHVNVSGFGQVLDKSVTIPDVHIQNVGTAGNAVTAAELGRQILEPVFMSAVKTSGDEFLKNNKDVQKGLQQLNKAAPGLTNLIKF
jgi:hypothetical protein